MKYKNNIQSAIYKHATHLPMHWMRYMSGQNLVLPFYHLATEIVPEHIKYLYTPKTLKEFEADLDFLLRHFVPLSLEDLRDKVTFPVKKSKAGFFLSFDDGLTEFHDYIAPILMKKGIPAAVFVNPSFVDNQDLFYRYKVSLLISQIKKSPKELLNPELIAVMKTLSIGDDVGQKLLSIDYRNRSILDNIAQIIGVQFEAYLSKHTPYMTKTQLLSLKSDGFYIGGHSMDHPRYELISLTEQIRQTKMSIDWVFRELNCDDRIFAFPFTDYKVSKEFFDEIHQKEWITFGTAGLKNDSIPFNLQRIPMGRHLQSSEKILKYEYLYYITKSFVGKNTIRR
ncbi:MAG: polysaccharide deacetylase family protein [Saprospiraceae bacterium]